MAQGYHPDTDDLVDKEVRHSIRVIKQQRNAKMLAFVLFAVIGVLVLFYGAYVGLR